MALLVDIPYKGLNLVGVYASIGELTISPAKDIMSFVLEYRVNTDSELLTQQVFNTFYDLEGGNPYAQAYAFLETLPEYSGCVKV